MTTTSLLDPRVFGRWIRLLREGLEWSQEALAEAAGLTTRTIQRVEAGDGSNVQTRKALARGLGYESSDVFSTPEFAKMLSNLNTELAEISREALAKRFPDKVSLPVTRIRSGEQLGRLAEATNAHHLHYDEDIAPESKAIAAAIFDSFRDYGDCDDLYSEVEKLSIFESFDDLVRNLEKTSAVAYCATRSTKIVGESWPDKTPIRLDVAYIVVTKNQSLKEIWAAKRIGFKF